MVELVPIEQEEFETFLQRAVIEYADDHVRNGNWSPEDARERSKKEFDSLLPEGIHSKDQYVYSIRSGDTRLGVLWVQIKEQRAFIYNFIVEEEFRGKGYGKQALAALDDLLTTMNVASVALHVFGDNMTAQGLYRKMGFQVTGIHMRKKLK